MRILHVTNTYLPVRNGVTVSVAGWLRALEQQDHEVAVWTVSKAPSDEPGVFVTRGVAEIAHGFPVPLDVRPPAAIRDVHWDVVHAHHPVMLGPRALQLARRNGAVFATTVHSDYVAYVDSYAASVAVVARPVVRSRMRHFFRAADVVFAPSPGIAAAVASWGVTGPIVPLTYPIDRRAFGALSREEARARLGLSRNTPVALYAGRFAADKHVERLIEEFREAQARVPEAILALVGGGPLAARVSETASSLLGTQAVLPGELPPEEVAVWYSAADLFVSASPNEVGPLALIEAGLCHTPAVAHDVPGFRDRIAHGENGLLAGVEPGALGRQMAVLLGDRERAHRMGDVAARRFAGHVAEESARHLIAAYEEAAETKRERGSLPRRTNYTPGAERS